MGAHLPLPGLEPVGGEPLMSVTCGQCDARPTVYLPSCKASLPIGWYQIILLGDRGTCVLTTYPGCTWQQWGHSFIHSFIVFLITPLDKTQWTARTNTIMRHAVSKNNILKNTWRKTNILICLSITFKTHSRIRFTQFTGMGSALFADWDEQRLCQYQWYFSS